MISSLGQHKGSEIINRQITESQFKFTLTEFLGENQDSEI